LNRSAAEDRHDAARPIRRGQVRLAGGKRADDRKSTCPFLELEKLRRRDPELIEAHLGELARDVDEPIGLGIAERAQDDGVHHREDGGVRADTQRQREHGHRRKTWRPQQVAASVPQVANQTIHQRPPGTDTRSAA
jgi:hypothetical protein